MQQALEAAEILGRQSEAAHLNERIEKVKRAIDVAYFSPFSHTYIGDIQGASCLALRIGLGDDKTLKVITEKYKKLGTFDTGIIATEALIGVLFENGEDQLAFDLLSNEGGNSFGKEAASGATTIWEYWSGIESQNHPMFGAATKYLFMYLLGIRQPEGEAGYKKAVISPRFVDGLSRAKGHITTENGIISVEYVKDEKSATVKVFADPKIEAVFEHNGINTPFSGEKEFNIEI